MAQGRHWTSRGLYLCIWRKQEWKSLIRGRIFVHKRVVSAVREEFASNGLSCDRNRSVL
jgi:hypothetical protein